MQNNKILYITLTIGALLVGAGVYSLLSSQSSRSLMPGLSARRLETMPLPANCSGWQPVGKGRFILQATGTIDYGGLTATPDSSPKLGDATALVPGIPFGALVAKIGENGKPFKAGSLYEFDTQENVYIVINDSTYNDNTGEYVITIER